MKTNIFLLLFISVAVFAQAQILKPVKWTIESNKISDNEFEVVYTANIDKGWHLYSQFVKPDGPTPTSFNLEESPKFSPIGNVTEEKGHVVYEELFKMDVKYFNDKAIFKQKIRKAKNEKVNVVGEIDYMACNGSSCTVGYFDIDIDI